MATLSLTNCIKETQIAPETESVPYTLYANHEADTKTVNDGLSTRWTEEDALNVFHTETGTEWYSENTKFTITDVETGQFDTDLLNGELSDRNDWFVFYPYSEYIISPNDDANGYMTVASAASVAQLQNGNNSMAHIAGPNYPMWGIAKNVESEEMPYVRMTHLTSLVEVVVTNNAEAETVVKSLELIAAEDIVGTYYIDFSTDVPSFVPSGDSYVSNVAKLKVVDGEYIPVGESAKFYIAVKPFTAHAGDFLTLVVNGVEKDLELTEDVVFAPGKIKTLNIGVDKAISAEPVVATVADVLEAEPSDYEWYQVTGTITDIVNTTYGNFYIEDETGSIYVYGLTATNVGKNDKSFASLGLREGDLLTLIGIRSEYKGEAQMGTSANQSYYVSHEAGPYIELKPAGELWMPVEGASRVVTVDANVEYTLTVEDNDWLTVVEESDGVYAFTAAANDEFEYRSVPVYVTAVDEAYADLAQTYYVFQNGRANKLWAKHPAEDFEGYDPSQRVKLAMYGEYVLLANTSRIYLLDPATGDVVNTIDMPAGFAAHNVLVDDAGNMLVGADALDGTGDVTLYYVADPFNPVPEPLISWNAGNYYSAGAGNIRVKGNVKDDAVITAVVTDGAGGACLAWEVVDGVVGDWKWTNPPYTNWNVPSLCFAPLGSTMADGFFYIGYGGDYNLQYTDNFVAGGGTTWAASYVTGSSWMENYNCISTAEWNGNKYAAIVAGCHFNYDATDVMLLNVNDPAAAELVYKHAGDGDVAWDWDAGVNPSWTGLGTFSDVLLVPAEEDILMIYVDSNYGAMACVAVR